MNIDKEMNLHPFRDSHSTFYEGVQKNKIFTGGSLKSKNGVMQKASAFCIQPIKEVHF